MTLSNPAQYISGRTVQEQMNSLIDYVDQRAADVALDAIASDVAQVHQDMLDADADASAAAASAAAAAGTLANAVKKTGEASQSIAGDIAVAGDLTVSTDLAVSGDAAIQGLLSVLGGCDLRAPVKIPVTPTNNDDAASKKYVDDSLDNYAPMLRTTGNQTKTGSLTFRQNTGTPSLLINHAGINLSNPVTSPQNVTLISLGDTNGTALASFMLQRRTDDGTTLYVNIRNADGTYKFVNIASGNP